MPASVRGGEKEDYGQGEVGETNGLVAAARSHLTGAPTPKHHIGIPWQGEGWKDVTRAAVVCWSWSFFTSSQAHGSIGRDSRELVMKPLVDGRLPW